MTSGCLYFIKLLSLWISFVEVRTRQVQKIKSFQCSHSGSKCFPWSIPANTTTTNHQHPQQLFGFKCHINNQLSLLPQHTLHDNTGKCDDHNTTCLSVHTCPLCLDHNKTIISAPQICDGVLDCPDWSDECCCQNSPLEELCELAYPIQSAHLGISKLSAVCDVIETKETYDKFCVLSPDLSVFDSGGKVLEKNNESCPVYKQLTKGIFNQSKRAIKFSSELELIWLVPIRHCVCMVGLLSVVANLFALRILARKLGAIHEERGSMYHHNVCLIFQLALADLFMGVALTIMTMKAILASGHYCRVDHEWRTSVWCNVIGVLFSISNMTSMAIMVLLTTLRLKTTLQPLTEHKIRRVLFIAVSVSIWVIPLLVTLLPILLDVGAIPRQIVIDPNPYFGSTVVWAGEMERYIRRTRLMSPDVEASFDYVTSDHFRTLYKFRHVHLRHRFGYYSHYAICFPDIYSFIKHENIQGKLILIFLFCSLLYISVCYTFIYKRSTTSSTGRDCDVRSRDNDRLRRRITLVVVTNVVSWMPFIILTIVKSVATLYDAKMEQICVIIQQVISLLCLPITSVVNPVIYSRVHVRLWESFRAMWKPCVQVRQGRRKAS